MEDSDDAAFNAFLMEHGLTDPKWVMCFREQQITKPDQVLAVKGVEEVYQALSTEASPTECTILKKMLRISTQPATTIDKICGALEEAGLDVVYWSRVIAKQIGVITAEAMNHVQSDFYPHLVQFARSLPEKKALQKLLNFEKEDGSFEDHYEKQVKTIELRRLESLQLLKEMKEFQVEGKGFEDDEVQTLKNRVLERLQIPQEFWCLEDECVDFISEMEVVHAKMKNVLDKREVLKDANIIKNASAGLALQGVFATNTKMLPRKRFLCKSQRV